MAGDAATWALQTRLFSPVINEPNDDDISQLIVKNCSIITIDILVVCPPLISSQHVQMIATCGIWSWSTIVTADFNASVALRAHGDVSTGINL